MMLNFFFYVYINKAIHVLLIHVFAGSRKSIPRPLQKLTSSAITFTVANVISRRQDDVSLCPGRDVFKTFADNVSFRAIIDTGKKNFSKHFRVTKCVNALIATKQSHAFPIH